MAVDYSKLSDAELDAIISGSPSKSEDPKHEVSIGRNLGQFAAGIPAGIASIADLPAAAGNLGLWGAEKIGNALGSDYKTPTIPYYAHEGVTKLTNKIVGEPKNNQEEIARTAGNIGGAFINPTNVFRNIGEKAASASKLGTFKEAGITPTLGEITTSRPLMGTEELLKRTPGSAKVYEDAATLRDKELTELFSKHGQIDKAVPVNEGGELVKKGAKAYNDKAKSVANKLYEKAWGGIEANTPVPLPNTLKVIDESLAAITPQAREILQKSTSGKTLIQLENAIKGNNGTLPIADIKKVYRKEIDDLVNTWGQVGSNEQGVLKNIRNALDAETKQFVIAENPKAAKDFAKADKFWSGFSERNKKIANKVAGQESPVLAFNQSLGALKQGDASKVKVLMQRLPKEDKGVLSATYMNELGRGVGGEFDPNKWGREFSKLRPEAKEVFTSGLPKESASKLNKISEALAHGRLTKGQANHSGTAYTGLLMGAGAGLLHSPIETLGGAALGFGLSKMFTNPKLVDAVYAASKAKDPVVLHKILNSARYSKLLPTLAALKAASGNGQENNGTDYSKLSDEELDNIIGKPNVENVVEKRQPEQAPLSQNDSYKADSSDFMDSLGSGGEGNYNKSVDLFNNVGTQ